MRPSVLSAAAWVWCAALVVSQPGVISPLAEDCGPSSANVVCINHYSSVMPYHFFRRPATTADKVNYGQTEVPDKSFSIVEGADFLVYEKARGLPILGSKPTYEFVFNVSSAVHEAPVYAPVQNLLFVSQLGPPLGILPQLVINLNVNPPTIANYTPDPPVYEPNGGSFRNGMIIFGTAGGIDSIGGGEQRTGLRSVDPATNKSTVLLNNYFGSYFNGIDDIAVHPVTKDIWFTDPTYAFFNGETDTSPQLPIASWRFRPSTGEVQVVEDAIQLPNGIAFDPSGQHCYISDSGSSNGIINATVGQRRLPFNVMGPRTIYKYDVSADNTYLMNKRAIYLSQDWIPDGVKVAANGYVVTGTGSGVDVLDANGTPLVRVQTNFTVQNIQWTGEDRKTMWMVGNGGIARVQWELNGQVVT